MPTGSVAESPTATQRPRSRWRRARRILAALALLLFITFAALTVFAVRVMYAKPGGDAGYAAAMEKLASEYQPSTGENGLELIELLSNERRRLEAEVLNGEPEARFYYESFEPSFEPQELPAEADRARAQGVFDRYPQSAMPQLWNRLVEAKRFTREWPDEPLIRALFPDLGDARALARMNGGRMYLGAQRTNWSEVVKPYEQSLAMSRLIAHDTTPLSRLVSIAVQMKSDMDLRHILVERRLPQQVLEELITVHTRQAITTPPSLSLRGDQLVFQDFVQHSHTDDGRGDGRLLLTEFGQLTSSIANVTSPRDFDLKIYNLLGLLAASKSETLRRGETHYDLIAALADTPKHTRDPSEVQAAETFTDQRDLQYLVLTILAPSIDKILKSADQSHAEHVGLRLILEIELFRARSARLPTSLDELVKDLSPDAAAKLLTDPFTGKRFGYQILPAPEAPAEGMPFGRDYLLYSFGLDGIDDLGIEANVSGQPFAALHDEDQNGTDLIINRPRPVKKPD